MKPVIFGLTSFQESRKLWAPPPTSLPLWDHQTDFK